MTKFQKEIYITVDPNTDGGNDLLAWRELGDGVEDDGTLRFGDSIPPRTPRGGGETMTRWSSSDGFGGCKPPGEMMLHTGPAYCWHLATTPCLCPCHITIAISADPDPEREDAPRA